METPSKDGCWFPPLEVVLDQWKDHCAGKAGATVFSWHWSWCYVIRSNHFSSVHLFSLHLPCPFKLLGKGSALCGQWWNNIFILLVLQSCLKLLFTKWPLDLSIVGFFIFFQPFTFPLQVWPHADVFDYFFITIVLALILQLSAQITGCCTNMMKSSRVSRFLFLPWKQCETPEFLLLGTSSSWAQGCVCICVCCPPAVFRCEITWAVFSIAFYEGPRCCAVCLIVCESKLWSIEN